MTAERLTSVVVLSIILAVVVGMYSSCEPLAGDHSARARPAAVRTRTGQRALGRVRRCDPNYGGTCVPLVPGDLDCQDVHGPVTILALDPHHLDDDGDGRACG